MKKIIFIAVLVLGIHYVLSAQEFEHFAVRHSLPTSWRLTLKADTTLQLLGGEEERSKPSKDAGEILKQIKENVRTLPEEIKEKARMLSMVIMFGFNPQGEVVRSTVFFRADTPTCMTEEEWLQFWKVIFNVRVDVKYFDTKKYYTWSYNITKILQSIEGSQQKKEESQIK